MTGIDLYHQRGMEKLFWGGVLEYPLATHKLSTARDILTLLDEICILEKLNPIGECWTKIPVESSTKRLYDALAYDLAFTASDRMPRTDAQYCYDQIMHHIDLNECAVYANWSISPWDPAPGHGFCGITNNTFDLALAFVHINKVILFYVISED